MSSNCGCVFCQQSAPIDRKCNYSIEIQWASMTRCFTYAFPTTHSTPVRGWAALVFAMGTVPCHVPNTLLWSGCTLPVIAKMSFIASHLVALRRGFLSEFWPLPFSIKTSPTIRFFAKSQRNKLVVYQLPGPQDSTKTELLTTGMWHTATHVSNSLRTCSRSIRHTRRSLLHIAVV